MPIVGLIAAGVVAFRLQASGWEKEVAEDLYGQLTGFAAPFDRVPSDIDPVGSRKSRASGGCCKAEKRCFYVE